MKEYDEEVRKLQLNDKKENILEKDELLVSKNNNVGDFLIIENDKIQSKKKTSYDATKDLPEVLVRSLDLLADDKAKASEYFKPVIASANKVLRGCSSKEEMETELTNLVQHMCYYLDNRKPNFLMSSRNARRAACERVMTCIGHYMYDCEGVQFANKMQVKVHDIQKSHNFESSYIDGFKREYGQCLSDSFLSGRLAQKDIMNIPMDKVTKEVSDIIMGLEGAQSILTNKMPPTPEDDADPKKVTAFQNEIRNVGLLLSHMYDKVITSCKSYLSLARRDPMVTILVKDIMSISEYDRKIFVSSITQYVAGHKGQEVVTWGDALADKGSVLVQLADKDVEKLGAGTSVLYKYNIKGENKYFKEQEKSSNNIGQTWKAIKDRIKDMPSYKPEYDELIKGLDDAVEEQLGLVMDVSFKNYRQNDALKHHYQNLIAGFLFSDLKGNLVEKAKAMMGNLAKNLFVALNPLIRFLADLEGDKDTKEFFSNIVSDFLKHFNSDIITASSAKIDEGSVISQRNVATSRMGDLLGISHLVMRSETTEVMSGKKKLVGNVMDEAVGKAAYDVLKENKSGNKYSINVVKDLATMHVFDLICGQIDRNRDNYYLEAKDGTITGLKMIDNDISFGLINSIKKGSSSILQLSPVNNELIDALPSAVKANIKKLAKLSKGDFGFFFGDLLTDKEIEFLMDRLNTVNEAIQERENYYSDLLINGSEEEKKLASLMEDDDFKAVYYQYRIYREVTKRWKTYYNKHKNDPDKMKKGDFIYNDMRRKTYLAYGNIPYDQLEEMYKNYFK